MPDVEGTGGESRRIVGLALFFVGHTTSNDAKVAAVCTRLADELCHEVILGQPPTYSDEDHAYLLELIREARIAVAEAMGCGVSIHLGAFLRTIPSEEELEAMTRAGPKGVIGHPDVIGTLMVTEVLEIGQA